jgi:plastocyanin
MSERIRLVFTFIAVVLVGIATGFFLHGSLPPAQVAGLQLFDKMVVTSINKSTVVHGGDGFGQHTHVITATTTVTETTPHGDFPDFAEKLAPWAFTNATIAKQGTYEIWIYGREFTPNTLTVPAGTKVTWVNKSSEQHTVSSNISLFNSFVYINGSIDDSFSYTFTEPGTYNYYCQPHLSSGMLGKIIVTAR